MPNAECQRRMLNAKCRMLKAQGVVMKRLVGIGLLGTLAMASVAAAQGTQADYDRALGLRKQYEALVGNAAEAPRWIDRTHRLYYRRTVKGGHDFILADADTKTKQPAFD